MPTRLYLIRHARAHNADHLWTGTLDLSLGEVGLRQAEQVARALRRAPLQAVYSSPLVRAMDTARPLANARRLDVRIIPDLREMAMGAWEGLRDNEVRERFGPVFQQFWEHPESAEIPGAEALLAVRERVMVALQEIVSRHPDGSAAVVAHGIVNRVAILTLIGAPLASIWRIKQDNACINVLEVDGGHTILRILNETSHLK